jgi:hypothetical protein
VTWRRRRGRPVVGGRRPAARVWVAAFLLALASLPGAGCVKIHTDRFYTSGGRPLWVRSYYYGDSVNRKVLHGTLKTWYPDGAPKLLAEYRDGQMDGRCIRWYGSGRRAGEQTYRRGREEGLARVWDEAGELLASGEYRDGAPWEGTFGEWAEGESLPGQAPVQIRRYSAGVAVATSPLPAAVTSAK